MRRNKEAITGNKNRKERDQKENIMWGGLSRGSLCLNEPFNVLENHDLFQEKISSLRGRVCEEETLCMTESVKNK